MDVRAIKGSGIKWVSHPHYAHEGIIIQQTVQNVSRSGNAQWCDVGFLKTFKII
jgi:hypothetical protein